MLLVKKSTCKLSLVLYLSALISIVLPFTVLPSKAAEINALTASPAIVAQADTATPTAESVEPVAPGEISAETRAKIEELLDITNASELNTQVMEGIIAQFREISPEVPDAWWDRFIEKVNYAELDDLLIPIYAQNFTNEELDGIIDFYRTPIGQSVLTKMPMVVQDSLTAGQSWGIRIAQEVIDELAADGYELPAEQI